MLRSSRRPGQRSRFSVYGGEDHGNVQTADCFYPFVNQAADEDQSLDMILPRHPLRRAELIAAFVNVLGDEIVRHIVGTFQDRLRQGIEERIGAAPDDHADHFVTLFQAPGIGVSDKMTVPDDLLDFLPGCDIDVRTVVQHTADGCNRNPGHCGNVFDCIYLHAGTPFVFLHLTHSGNDIGNVFSQRLSQPAGSVNAFLFFNGNIDFSKRIFYNNYSMYFGR